jgi:hypothetical protein
MRLSLIPYDNIIGMDYSSDGYGLFGGGTTGSVSAYTDKYVYNNNVVAAGTVLGLARYLFSACGNSIVGIFGGGRDASYYVYTDKYTYSNNVVTVGTVLSSARNPQAACGNSTVGIFGGGDTGSVSAYTDKYTYSNNVVAAGTALGLARNHLTSTGNSIVGIFGGGYTGSNVTYTDKYTYSNNVVAAGTALGLAKRLLNATGNSAVGIFGGGYTGSISVYTDKYIYSNNAVSQGTNLGLARYGLAATSSQPCSISYLNIKVAEAYYPLRVKYPTQTKLMISGNERIFDSTGKAVTVNGNTVISTSQSKIGGSSIYFDGTGDYLSLANSADFAWPAACTFDFWMYAIDNNDNYPQVFDFRVGTDNQNRPMIRLFGSAISTFLNVDQVGTTNLYTSGWAHIAIVRNGGIRKAYVNGIQEVSVADTATYLSAPLSIGDRNTTGVPFKGYLSFIRLTHSALWTSNFTPPSKIADYYQTTGYLGR